MKTLPYNPAPLTLEQVSELIGTRPEELKAVKAIAQQARRPKADVVVMVRRKRAVVAVAQAKHA